MTSPPELVALGVIARPHGVRGTVRVHVYNKESELLHTLEEIILRTTDGKLTNTRVSKVRRGPKATLIDIEGCRSMESAEALRGAELCVPRDSLPILPKGQFYHIDLPGFVVFYEGEEIGKVVEVLEYPSVDCLKVATATGHIEVPMRPEWLLEVDVARGKVTVEGISDLPVEAFGESEP